MGRDRGQSLSPTSFPHRLCSLEVPKGRRSNNKSHRLQAALTWLLYRCLQKHGLLGDIPQLINQVLGINYYIQKRFLGLVHAKNDPSRRRSGGKENSISPESPVTAASEHRGPRDKPNIYGQTNHSLIFFL